MVTALDLELRLPQVTGLEWRSGGRVELNSSSAFTGWIKGKVR